MIGKPYSSAILLSLLYSVHGDVFSRTELCECRFIFAWTKMTAICKRIFFIARCVIIFSLKFVLKGPINNNPALGLDDS